jgi:hypothetical protein
LLHNYKHNTSGWQYYSDANIVLKVFINHKQQRAYASSVGKPILQIDELGQRISTAYDTH